MSRETNKDLPKLLRAIAASQDAQKYGHDIIFNAAADELDAAWKVHPAIPTFALQVGRTVAGIEVHRNGWWTYLNSKHGAMALTPTQAHLISSLLHAAALMCEYD